MDIKQMLYKGTTGTKKENEAEYEAFLTENRERINKNLGVLLIVASFAGPAIAVGIAVHFFKNISYSTAVWMSVFMLVLTGVNHVLNKKYPTSYLTGIFSLLAIDMLLFVMNGAHVTIYITWFLVPLISIRYCDYYAYWIALVMNYCFMLGATWQMSSYVVENSLNYDSRVEYFVARAGGLTIELTIMAVGGYFLCRMMRVYYCGMIDKYAEAERNYEISQNLRDELGALADIYITAFEIDLYNDRCREIRSNDAALSKLMESANHDVRITLCDIMESHASDEFKDEVLEFIDFDTIDLRMKDRNIITIEYKNSRNLWRRGRLVAYKRDEDGRITNLIGMVEDIDDERRSRDKLVEMSERAIAASEAKSAFLSNVSHEIRTPMNAVLGMNEIILRESRDPNALEYAQGIKLAGNTLLGLINDLLDFSKIEAGKMEIVPVDYDLSSMVNDLVNMLHVRADQKGLAVELKFTRDIPRLLRGDELRIKQAITNILNNAVKYTETGTVTFVLDYDIVEGEKNVISLKVSVEDTGIGIRQEDMDKLFVQFERIDLNKNRRIEGTGLGLSITKRLLDMMGSTLKVESEYGKGSRFFFELRQPVVKWDTLGDYETNYREWLASRKRYKEKFTAPRVKVLVVDDNQMNLRVFQGLLRKTQVRTDLAMSGDEGLQKAAERRYDIIFLDHMMPIKDGIETLHELRAMENGLNKKTPVICLTANAVSGARDYYLSEGFDDYLSKPIDYAKLEDIMIEHLPDDALMPEGSIFAYELTKPKQNDEPEHQIPDALAAIGEIDIKEGIKNSGSVEDYMALLKIFYNDLDRNIQELDDLYENDRLKEYTVSVHAMKSSSWIIGAFALGEEARMLEDAGKKKDMVYIRSHHDGYIKNLRIFRDLVTPVFVSEEDEAEKPTADSAFIKWKYDEIRDACEINDCDVLDEVFEELDKYSIEGEDAEKIEKLKRFYDKFDYDSMLALL